MKERISCFDIDGTLSKELLFIPLVKREYESGYLEEDSYAAIRELLLNYKSGELTYEDAVEQLLQAHANGLKGKNCDDLKTHAEHFLVSREEQLFRTFGRKVIHLLQVKQEVYAVTAEPQYLAEAVMDMYGMNGAISTLYGEEKGTFNGEVERSLAHRSAKSSALQRYTIVHAFGDSEGDIDMLADAEHRYCISPTEGLATVAQDQNWRVYNGDDEGRIVEAVRATLE